MEEKPITIQDMDTGELLEIWGQNDRKRYTTQDFEAIRLVLVQRLGSAPAQKQGALYPLAPKTNIEPVVKTSGRRLLRGYLISVLLLALLVGLLSASLVLGLEFIIYLFGSLSGSFTVLTNSLWLLILGTIAILPLALGCYVLARRLVSLHAELLARLEPPADEKTVLPDVEK